MMQMDVIGCMYWNTVDILYRQENQHTEAIMYYDSIVQQSDQNEEVFYTTSDLYYKWKNASSVIYFQWPTLCEYEGKADRLGFLPF